jgi:hypothetical protein
MFFKEAVITKLRMKQNLRLSNAFLKNTEGSLQKLWQIMPNNKK